VLLGIVVPTACPVAATQPTYSYKSSVASQPTANPVATTAPSYSSNNYQATAQDPIDPPRKTPTDDYEQKLRNQRDKWKSDNQSSWTEWRDVGRTGAPGEKVRIADPVSNINFNTAMKNLNEAVGDTDFDFQPKIKKTSTTTTSRGPLPQGKIERELPAHLAEDPFSRIDELRVDFVDAEQVRRREEEAERERRKIEDDKKRKKEGEQRALENARREEERIKREREERRRREEIELQNQKQKRQEEEAKKRRLITATYDDKPYTPTSYGSSRNTSKVDDEFDLGLGDLNNLTSELDNMIGSIATVRPGEDALEKQKRTRDHERKKVERVLEDRRFQEDERKRIDDERKEEERKRKMEEIAEQKRKNERLEREAEEREKRMDAEQRKKEAMKGREWNFGLNDSIGNLLMKLQQFDFKPYTQELGMEYVMAMKEVSNSIDDVFPLLADADVRTVAAQMKQMVLLSTDFVNSARSKAEDPSNAARYAKYTELKDSVRALLSQLKQSIETSVKSSMEKKKRKQCKDTAVS